jgi:hypothetical protein
MGSEHGLREVLIVIPITLIPQWPHSIDIRKKEARASIFVQKEISF